MMRTTLLALLLAMPALAAEPAGRIDDFNKPFLFSYLAWQNKVRTEGGKAILRGVTPQGGAGQNVTRDLSRHPDWSPYLRVTVHPDNKAKALKLLLRDANERPGSWMFQLPTTPGDAVLAPDDGAPLSHPSQVEHKGPPELARITQLQLIGDWGKEQPLSVTVTAVTAGPPTAEVVRLRQANEAKRREEAARREQQRKALVARYEMRGPESPTVAHVSAAAPDVFSLTIIAGRITPSKLVKYEQKPGDRQEKGGEGVVLHRDGKRVGWLIGVKKDDLVTFERFAGDPLLDFLADDAATFTVRSMDDPAFTDATKPTAAHRKSRPLDWAQPSNDFVMEHTVYLRLPHRLTAGKRYTVDLGRLNTREPQATLTFDPATVRSEAVHVSQVGFRPDDPVKEGRLSLWMGTGGGCDFASCRTFRLVNDADGRTVFTGKVEPHWPADKTEKLARTENFVKAPVYRLDFAAFHTPGRYRLVVDGVGCSYPFAVADDVWQRAFLTKMKGLFNNRSGLELGPPYTPFRKPRDFHPADGVRVTHTTFVATPGSSDQDHFKALPKHDTGKPAPEAWGGYHDAGDWQPRRATHLRVTMAQLELLDLFPGYYRKLSWPLPKTSKAPAILDEALWELDLFRRLQKADGGVPFGIETPGDPITGEVSWNQSHPAYVYAPDRLSSYVYASAAARAARLLPPTDPELAATYRASAIKAMEWAEADVAKHTKGKLHWETRDERNLAALELYHLTGEQRWHAVFKSTTCLTDAAPNLFAYGDHVQINAAFGYARLPADKADATLQRKAKAAMARLADRALVYATGNAYALTHHDANRPLFLGFFSTPEAGPVLTKAHALTGEAKYLAGAVRAALFSAGMNPRNGTYTTGLGANPPRNPLKLDARRTGQPAPEGLTVYGNLDYWTWKGGFWDWPITWHLPRVCTPNPYDWPLPEAYFDIFLYPAMTEYTVDTWAPSVSTWGYLAARPVTRSD